MTEAPPFCTRVLYRQGDKVCIGELQHAKNSRPRSGEPYGRQHWFSVDPSFGHPPLPTHWCPFPGAYGPWQPEPRFNAPMEVEVLVRKVEDDKPWYWLEANDPKPLPFPGLFGQHHRFQGAQAWMAIEDAVQFVGGWREVPQELLEGEEPAEIRQREMAEWALNQAHALYLAIINDGEAYAKVWSPIVEGAKVRSHRYLVGMADWLYRQEHGRDRPSRTYFTANRADCLFSYAFGQVNGFLRANPDAIDRDADFIDERLAVNLATQEVVAYYARAYKERLKRAL